MSRSKQTDMFPKKGGEIPITRWALIGPTGSGKTQASVYLTALEKLSRPKVEIVSISPSMKVDEAWIFGKKLFKKTTGKKLVDKEISVLTKNVSRWLYGRVMNEDNNEPPMLLLVDDWGNNPLINNVRIENPFKEVDRRARQTRISVIRLAQKPSQVEVDLRTNIQNAGIFKTSKDVDLNFIAKEILGVERAVLDRLTTVAWRNEFDALLGRDINTGNPKFYRWPACPDPNNPLVRPDPTPITLGDEAIHNFFHYL